MHFIKVTRDCEEGTFVFINVEMVSMILRYETYTRIIFNYKCDTGPAYVDVIETPEEIMKMA